MFKGKGRVEYRENPLSAYLLIDGGEDLVAYYRKLIPPSYGVKPSLYAPHITISRGGVETIEEKLWEGRVLNFSYALPIYYSYPYFFLCVESEEIGNLRELLGLPRWRFSDKTYHVTVGNTK